MKIIFEPNYVARMGHVRAIRIFDRGGGPFNAELTWPNGDPFIKGNYGADGREIEKEALTFAADLLAQFGICRVRLKVVLDHGGGGFGPYGAANQEFQQEVILRLDEVQSDFDLLMKNLGLRDGFTILGWDL